ncbi:hypothetical protein Taro_051005 [Colocasia esculenta]|uniref:Uncharacterized protein n=1 Tax=Colocasia esculenta TaxID=4460 RepID=A0A843XFI4_COLES|nr:hypothetical protein [Colocasia esculenta]
MASTAAGTALLLLVVSCCLLPGGRARLCRGFSSACCGSTPGGVLEVPCRKPVLLEWKTSEFYAEGIRRRLMGDREGSKPPSPSGNPHGQTKSWRPPSPPKSLRSLRLPPA